jgi:serine/threonine-protein kinase RsbW
MQVTEKDKTHLRLAIRNEIGELAVVNDAVQAFLSAAGAPDRLRFTADMSIEEVVTNMIKYGYDDRDAHEIMLSVKCAGNALELVFEDDGHPFDPLAAPEPDTDLPLEERTPGGLGLHLVRGMADTMAWERKNGRNILTITITP